MLIMYLGKGSMQQRMLAPGLRLWGAWRSTGPLGLPEGQTCSVHDRTAELSKLLAATQQQLEQAQGPHAMGGKGEAGMRPAEAAELRQQLQQAHGAVREAAQHAREAAQQLKERDAAARKAEAWAAATEEAAQHLREELAQAAVAVEEREHAAAASLQHAQAAQAELDSEVAACGERISASTQVQLLHHCPLLQ